jgi:membrane-associated phospholipid phosphatase
LIDLSLPKIKKYFAILIFSTFLLHCSSTKLHHGWGEDATISPGWQRVGQSAANAALQVETWIPFGTALLVAITDWDSEIQNWASQKTPVFGSVSSAVKVSDDLLKASTWVYLTSVVITPSGNDVSSVILNKGKGLATGISATFISQFMTSELKTLTQRERPDNSNNRSFPSGHTSAVANYTMLTSRNIEYMQLNPYLEGSIKIALNTMTLATGWARVEGNKHYPSDILVGAALGNFIGAFINDAFLGRFFYNISLNTYINKYQQSLQISIKF